MPAAMNDEAGGQRRRDPTILNQSTIYSWSQDTLTASGMVATPSDEFHRTSYNFACQRRHPKSGQDYAHRKKHRSR